MDKEELDAILAYCDECAPGPWHVGDEVGRHVGEVVSLCDCCGLIATCAQFGAAETRSNYHSEFIARARTDLPRVVKELVSAQAEVARLRRLDEALSASPPGDSPQRVTGGPAGE